MLLCYHKQLPQKQWIFQTGLWEHDEDKAITNRLQSWVLQFPETINYLWARFSARFAALCVSIFPGISCFSDLNQHPTSEKKKIWSTTVRAWSRSTPGQPVLHVCLYVALWKSNTSAANNCQYGSNFSRLNNNTFLFPESRVAHGLCLLVFVLYTDNTRLLAPGAVMPNFTSQSLPTDNTDVCNWFAKNTSALY